MIVEEPPVGIRRVQYGYLQSWFPGSISSSGGGVVVPHATSETCAPLVIAASS